MSVHGFSSRLATTGEVIRLQQYAGKALLIVNTASLCGFSASNMQGLNVLQMAYTNPHVRDLKFRDKLQVLAFPCNQFGAQEPKAECDIVAWAGSIYGNEFPIFEKTKVKGADAHPLFRFLSERLGVPSWNFTKYLCDMEGVPVRRYGPAVAPESLKDDINQLLQ